MITRMLTTGLLAGVLAGLFVSALQHVTTVPLILQAETYENAAPAPANHHSMLQGYGEAKLILAHATTEAPATPEAPEAWAPADGVERTAYTTLATIGTAIGLGLMLLALMLATGTDVSARSAALWGLAGFVATGLATGMGLSPELPGAAAADLLQRQIWWLATAAATATGIYAIMRNGSSAAIAIGLALIAAPHVVGAPHVDAHESRVPAELAAHFVAQSLAVHAVMWILTGAALGFFWQRLGATGAVAERP